MSWQNVLSPLMLVGERIKWSTYCAAWLGIAFVTASAVYSYWKQAVTFNLISFDSISFIILYIAIPFLFILLPAIALLKRMTSGWWAMILSAVFYLISSNLAFIMSEPAFASAEVWVRMHISNAISIAIFLLLLIDPPMFWNKHQISDDEGVIKRTLMNESIFVLSVFALIAIAVVCIILFGIYITIFG